MTNPQTNYAAVESKPVFWMDLRALRAILGVTSQDAASILGFQDVFERPATGQAIVDRMNGGARLPLGCVESITVTSTLTEPCFLASIDGACRQIRKIDTVNIDRALRADIDMRQLQDYAKASVIKNVAYNDVLHKASDFVQRNVFHRFLFYVNSRINEKNKAAVKPDVYTPELAGEAVYLIRSIRYIGQNDHDIKNAIQNSSLPKNIKDDLTYTEPESSVYNELNVRTLHAMLVYKVSLAEFHNRKHLLEKTNGLFFAMNGAAVLEHPYSASQQNGQDLSLGDGSRFAMNAEIVYHHYRAEARFLNVGGLVFEISQRQDISRPEGYHCNHRAPQADYEQSSEAKSHFIPMDRLTEENGFYRSYESAAMFYNKEQIAKRSQMLADAAKHQKEMAALEIEQIQTNIRAIAASGTKAVDGLNAAFKSLGKDAEMHLKESMADSAILAAKNETEIGKMTTQLYAQMAEAIKIERDKSKLASEEAKAQIEADQFSKRELIEILKLVPVTLAAIAGIINFMKGSKKK